MTVRFLVVRAIFMLCVPVFHSSPLLFVSLSHFLHFCVCLCLPGIESLKVLTESLSISVSPRVRLWSGHDSVKRIKAVTYQQLDAGVKVHFPFANEYTVRLYYIPDSRDITSRCKIGDDASYAEWRSCDPPPVIYVFAYTDDGLPSPPALPSPMTSVVSFGSDSATSSTRGHQQAAFRNALRKRDANKCVVTGLQFVKGTSNVVAAHIFGVERALHSHREKAGILNVYDTDNGFMLSAKWHLGFDQFQWCPNGEGQICVAEDAEDDMYLKYRTDQKHWLTIPSTDFLHKWPSEHVLAARFELFSQRVRQRSIANASDEQKTNE
jgi:hypothetical protein